MNAIIQSNPNLSYELSSVLPPFALYVLINSLSNLPNFNVHVSTTGEADSFIVQLATLISSQTTPEKEVFVLSQDSDFFIYKLQNYVPFDSLIIENLTVFDGKSKKQKPRLSFRSHSTFEVASKLNLNPDFLGLLASILGNDYFVDPELRSLLIELNPSFDFHTSSTRNKCRIQTIVNSITQLRSGILIKNETTDNLLSLVVSHLVKNCKNQIDREILYTKLYSSAKKYDLSILDKFTFVDAKKNLSLSESFTDLKEIASVGFFSHKLLELYNQNIFFCTPFIEDTAKVSIWEITSVLRSWISSIIIVTKGNQLDFQKWQDGLFTNFEYIRRGQNMTKVLSRPIEFAVFNGFLNDSTVLNHQFRIIQLDFHSRFDFFLQILSSNSHKIKTLNVKYLPLTLSIRWFIKSMFEKGTPLSKFQISAIIVSTIKSTLCNNITGDNLKTKPTKTSIHFISQMEVTLFSIFLLAQSLLLTHQTIQSDNLNFNFELFQKSFWIINGPYLHHSLSMAKKGIDTASILRAGCEGVDEAVFGGLGVLIGEVEEAVFDGGFELMVECFEKEVGVPKVKKKKKSGGVKNMGNIFDVLTGGIDWE